MAPSLHDGARLLRELPTRSWRVASGAVGLAAIQEPSVNLVCWRRRRRPRVTHALETWARSADMRHDAVIDPRTADLTQATRGLPLPVRDALTQDVAHLLALFAGLAGAARVRICFGVVRTDQCRKFHTDFLRQRLICTYAGPGTEWLPDTAVERSALRHPLDCPCDANRAIVRDATEIRRAAPFEVLVLKGELAAGGRGAVHRSPPLEAAGLQRVVLILSGVDEP